MARSAGTVFRPVCIVPRLRGVLCRKPGTVTRLVRFLGASVWWWNGVIRDGDIREVDGELFAIAADGGLARVVSRVQDVEEAQGPFPDRERILQSCLGSFDHSVCTTTGGNRVGAASVLDIASLIKLQAVSTRTSFEGYLVAVANRFLVHVMMWSVVA